MALELQISVFSSDSCEDLLFLDQTGLYSAGNTGGYGTPNPTVNSITSATITLTILGTTLVYEFTIASGVITAATATLASGTPVDILSLLTSTVWPFPDELILTPTFYSATFPELEDMVYVTKYEVSDGVDTYDVTENYLLTCATCCCINKAMTTVNINNADQVVKNLIPVAYMDTAQYATDNGNVSQANQFITKAYALCSGDSNCGCGCG